MASRSQSRRSDRKCQFTVNDLCCPITVDGQSSNHVVAFENALNAFRAAHYNAACPAISCPTAPSMMCNSQTSLCEQ